MGWAEGRIQEYQHGQPASWLERRMLEHANPVHFPLALAASIGLGYGLWAHDWLWVSGSAALALLGHVYCWTRQTGEAHGEPAPPGGDTSTRKGEGGEVAQVGPRSR
jgi:hypothetical protein